jgi:putative flippase GtrA
MLDKKLLKFVIVGDSNTLVSYMAFFVLYNYCFSEHTVVSQALSYFLGILWSFTWNRKWTFDSENHYFNEFIRFFISQLSMLLLSTTALYILVDLYSYDVNLSWFSVTLFLPLLNFFLLKTWVFQ